jgi:hypothetical protein
MMPFEMNCYLHKDDEFVDDIIDYTFGHINAKRHTNTLSINKCAYKRTMG